MTPNGNRAYKRLWLAVGALLANAENPKHVKTATAMCGKKELENLHRVWMSSKPAKKSART